jgi:hypothetical protein
MKKGQARGVLWHVSKLFSSLFSFIKQFLSSEITVKQVLTLKAHNMKKADINNSDVNLHTGSTEREHCPNAQTSGENMSYQILSTNKEQSNLRTVMSHRQILSVIRENYVQH